MIFERRVRKSVKGRGRIETGIGEVKERKEGGRKEREGKQSGKVTKQKKEMLAGKMEYRQGRQALG